MILKYCALCVMLFTALAALAQSVVMDTKALTISPGAAVGNKARIKWTVQKRSSVILQVLNTAGKCVRTLDAGNMAPGEYNVLYDGCDAAGKALPAGNYTIRLAITPTAELDATFGVGGVLGQSTRAFTFAKERKFNLGVKGFDAKTVAVKVDGEAWDREADFEVAGNTYTVDAAAGTVELNPTGELQKGAEIIISFALGLPLENPCVVKTASDGSLYIADSLYGLDVQNKKPTPRHGFVYKVDPTGNLVATFGKGGVLAQDCKDLAIDADGNLYVIALYHAVSVLDNQGKPRYTFAPFTVSTGQDGKDQVFGGHWPMSIAMNEARRAVIVNINGSNVLYDASKPDLTGFLAVQHAKQGMELPPVYWQYIGPCIAAQGEYYYMTTSYHRLIKYKFDAATKEFTTIWTTPAQEAASDIKLDGPDQLWMAMGVELDGTGLIYVADRQNHRVQIFFDAGHAYKHVGSIGSKGTDAGKCQLMAPHAVTLSPDRKSLYVAEDGAYVKHMANPVIRGLSRVVKWTLGAAETIETKLTVK